MLFNNPQQSLARTFLWLDFSDTAVFWTHALPLAWVFHTCGVVY